MLDRMTVQQLISHEECIQAVEHAFKLQGEGKTSAPGILGVQTSAGAFHIKAGVLKLRRNYFVAKVNGNFPNNFHQYGLPTIQGIIVVSDADNGELLAIMDSIEISIVRTGAATAIAAKYLARENSKTVMIIGCGNQGKVSAEMLVKVRNVETIFLYDIDQSRSKELAIALRRNLKCDVIPIEHWKEKIATSDICICCTPSKKPYLTNKNISPGTFIAAVGSDNDDKQELDPSLLTSTKVVTDITSQCAHIGELHHALKSGVVTLNDVHAELGEVVAGKKRGRTSETEIFIFDSTGMALQDVAASAIVYEKAEQNSTVARMTFNNAQVH
jgi:alanine dehydrogenase